MKNIRIIILLLFQIVLTLHVKAQTNMAFYPIENQFNSYNYNPAFLTSKGQFTFSIFPLAGTNFGYNNQNEIQNLISKLLSGINEDKDYIELVKSMVNRPTFYQKIESELLTFTFRSKMGILNFRVMENVSFSASVKGPVSEFMILPEVRSVVINEVQRIPALILHFREYSIGYSMSPKKNKLSAGIRAKLYFGKGVFSSEISGSIQDQSGNYLLKTWGKGNLSMPEETILNNDGTTTSIPSLAKSSVTSYLMNSGNPGFGIDLGVKYKITPKLSFSMSVIDLGKINWKSNLNSKSFDGMYNFNPSSFTKGYDQDSEIITKTSDSIAFLDAQSYEFKLTQVKSPFSTSLPLTFYAGINYQILPEIKLNLVDRYILMKDLNHHTFSITASFDLDKNLTVNTGYSIIGNTYSNIPLAVLLNRDFGQIYLGTDNLMAFLAPSISEFSGLSFGACFYLFRKRDLYGTPTSEFPYHKPKKLRKVKNDGRILKEVPEHISPMPFKNK
ncbi:MAG: DUF5723 family protein [Bacteroidota bacterium]|nr:DUF5723 family protein [Bacteroidota bacterium]